MWNTRQLFCLLIMVFSTVLTAQVNFRTGYEAAKPIPPGSNLNLDERVAIHEQFLQEATNNKDDLRQLYGYLYLFYDYLIEQDYAQAANYLLPAEQLANESGKPGWQGWVRHRRAILALRLDKIEEALDLYSQASELCQEAGDSLCMGESLEQMGAMLATLDRFDEGFRRFDQAIPLLEKFGSPRSVAASLNNYGILLARADRPAEAIPYYERSIVLNHENGFYLDEAKGRNNLADAYFRSGRLEEAITAFKECVAFNREHNFLENMISNFRGLYITYAEMNDYRSSNEYLLKHVELRDSIIGVETRERIADLEIRYQTEQKELALERSRNQLREARRSIELGIWVLLFILLLASMGVWRWYTQRQQAALDKQRNEENLMTMTRLLIDKNARLQDLEEELANQQAATEADDKDEATILSRRILTDKDWEAFKVYFDKTYPGFLTHLRNSYPSLSEAEERLFLFIKMNLSTKEAAIILGISVDGVKKTRYRLRKRIELVESTGLNEFIREF